jgi:predicted permease
MDAGMKTQKKHSNYYLYLLIFGIISFIVAVFLVYYVINTKMKNDMEMMICNYINGSSEQKSACTKRLADDTSNKSDDK